MPTTYTVVPDPTANHPKHGRERDLFTWLREHCEWRAGQMGEKAPIYRAYAAWEAARYGLPVADRSIEQSMVRLGFLIDQKNVMGLFPRSPNASFAVEQPSYSRTERLPGGSAAVSTPREMPILPDDDPIVAEQKRAFNQALNPVPPKEERFVEWGPEGDQR